jgi:hypothetical protein
MDNSKRCTNEDVEFGNKLREKINVGCKKNTMNQHDYFKKGLHVLPPQKTFSYE